MSTQDRKAKAQAAARTQGSGANAIIIGGIVVILAIVIVVGAVIIGAVRGSSGGDDLPQGVSEGEPIEPFADAKPAKDAPVVDVYEDFRCPACKGFEGVAGDTVTQLAEDGKIRLKVHLMTVIDNNVGGDSSAVAGSSAVCAADQGKWKEYHKALFEMQPEEETPEGFPEGTYTEAAEQAGLKGDALEKWQKCTDDGTYVDYVKGVDEAAAKKQITGTPAVTVDGTKFNWGALQDQKTGQYDLEEFEKVLTSGEVPKKLEMKEKAE